MSRCLHPDTPPTEAERAEAMRLFNGWRDSRKGKGRRIGWVRQFGIGGNTPPVADRWRFGPALSRKLADLVAVDLGHRLLARGRERRHAPALIAIRADVRAAIAVWPAVRHILQYLRNKDGSERSLI